jgi:hypothetical protein
VTLEKLEQMVQTEPILQFQDHREILENKEIQDQE